MNGNRENRRIISKDRRGAVPVMYVRINYDGLLDRSIRLQLSNRDRHIMNGTETFAMPRMRVMESSAEIRTESVAQRRLCRKNASTSGQPDRFDEFFRIGNFQRHHFAGRKRSGLQLSNPVPRVNAQDIFVACGIWAQEIFFRSDPFAEKH